MKLQRKLFSKKEDYKNGAETERQKKDRKKVVKALAGSGALLGAEFGAIGANHKASNKANRIISKAANRHISRANKSLDLINATKDRVNPQDMPTYIDLLKKVQGKLDHSKKTIEKASKSADKVVRKAIGKGALKGAAIGTGVGVGLGYLANKSMKQRNEEVNRAHRNKKKKD